MADLPDDGDVPAEDWDVLRARVRGVLAVAAELGDPVPAATVGMSDDPGLGTFQAAAVVGIGTFDQQQVLATTSVPERLDD